MIDERILAKSPWGKSTQFIVMAEAGSNAHGTVLSREAINHFLTQMQFLHLQNEAVV